MQTHSLYGNISGPLSGPFSGVSAGFHSPNASWQTLPDPENPSNRNPSSNKPSSNKLIFPPPVDPHLGHIKLDKPDLPEHAARAAGAADRAATSAAGASSSSDECAAAGGQESTMMSQEPTIMVQEPTVIESLAAAEGASIQDEIQYEPSDTSCALLNAMPSFHNSKMLQKEGGKDNFVAPHQSVETENAVRAEHAARAVRSESTGSSASQARIPGADSFAFLVPMVEGPASAEHAARSASRSSTGLSSSAHGSSMEHPTVTPMIPGEGVSVSHSSVSQQASEGVNQSPRFHSAKDLLPGEIPCPRGPHAPLSAAHPSFSHMLSETSHAMHGTHSLQESSDYYALAPPTRNSEQTSRDNTFDCDSAVLGPGPELTAKVDDLRVLASPHEALQATSVYKLKNDAKAAMPSVAEQLPRNSSSRGLQSPSQDSSYMSNETEKESAFSLALHPACLPSAVASTGDASANPKVEDVSNAETKSQSGSNRKVAVQSTHVPNVIQSLPVVSSGPCASHSGASSEQLTSGSVFSSPLDSPIPPSAPHTPSVTAKSPPTSVAGIPRYPLHAQEHLNLVLQHPQTSNEGSKGLSPSLRGVSQGDYQGAAPLSNRQTFVDMLNATSDGPVGQDVANDALDMVRSLPAPASRSQTDLTGALSGGYPSVSPLLDSSCSRVCSNCIFPIRTVCCNTIVSKRYYNNCACAWIHDLVSRLSSPF